MSIIIPTRDRQDLLLRAIRSATSQESRALEVVVVNDGGPITVPQDQSIKMVRTMGGVGLTRARLLAMTVLHPGTDAICYLDDDDELLPNHVRLLSARISDGTKFAFSRAIYKHANGLVTEDPEPNNNDPNKRYYDPTALLRQNVAPVSSFIHTRGAYDEVGGWDRSIIRMEDWDLWGRMFLRFGPPGVVPEVTNVIYKGHGANLTDSNPYVYAMACHWGDFVRLRLSCMDRRARGERLPDGFPPPIPRVSVLMPVHNAEKYLPQALDSLAGQTYGDFEVVAVNDGSTDGSRGILEDYRGRMGGRELRIFDLPSNVGVTRALNHGLMMSRTEYVARMDADDVSMPERLERQVRHMDENLDVGVLGTRFWSMSEDLSVVTWDNKVPTDPDEVKESLLKYCCIGHPTVMMRRRVIEVVGGYCEDAECEAVEDYELWLRASSRFRVANLPDYLLKYRGHGGQVGSRMGGVQRRNFEVIRERYAKQWCLGTSTG